MNKLERHNRRILKMVGLNPAKMTNAQIKRAVKATNGTTACGCGADSRRPAAVEAWRQLVCELTPALNQE